MNYPEIAFTEQVKILQEKYGSRASYARMEQTRSTDVLTQDEVEFIAQQDYFYLSTISESGFPYIQFRGGPKGFLRVLDPSTLAFIDFEGNKQYISTGNIVTNKKAALFFLDQAARARLKMFAEVDVLPISENPELAEKLELGDYSFKAKRIMIFRIQGYDWNCPQHITPRYTLPQVQDAFKDQIESAKILKVENELLKSQIRSLTELNGNPGSG